MCPVSFTSTPSHMCIFLDCSPSTVCGLLFAVYCVHFTMHRVLSPAYVILLLTFCASVTVYVRTSAFANALAHVQSMLQ